MPDTPSPTAPSFRSIFSQHVYNTTLGSFLGKHPQGLQAQCLAFRCDKALAGTGCLDRSPQPRIYRIHGSFMRLHCLRCLYRWHHSPAEYLALEAEIPPRHIAAAETPHVLVADPGDQAPFGWH